MKWRLDQDHHIDEQILPAGTLIGDDTPWPFRATHDDVKIGRKVGDPLPPSVSMTPVDDEAKKLFEKTYPGDSVPESDPMKSIPLTGAPDAPKVKNPAVTQQPERHTPAPPNPKPEETPKTGMAYEKPATTVEDKNP